MKKVIKWLFGLLVLFVLYIVGSIAYATVTDYQPNEIISLEIDQKATKKIIDKKRLTFLTWNIGYGGLGAKTNFFYDAGNFFFSGGKMVRSTKPLLDKYLQNISSFIAQKEADFVLLQEVDRASTRSYYTDEQIFLQQKIPNYSSTFATNFRVSRLPLPICEPWAVMGQMEAGLSTFSRYTAAEAVRYPFPVMPNWPNDLFSLDRCFLLERFETTDPNGKQLVVINTHNSAYGGGEQKKREMLYFKEIVLGEYQKGNYVIVGGDWNQSPPNVPFAAVAQSMGIAPDSSYNPGNITPDFTPESWQWAYDEKVPTNRSLTDTLAYGKTFVTLIDYYLLSPNIRVHSVKGENLKFADSDHNPVSIEIELLGLSPLK